MEKKLEGLLVPVSSDECGTDSDEDVITDYLGAAGGGGGGTGGGPSAVGGRDGGGRSRSTPYIMAHVGGGGHRGSAGGSPLVPTISVTPHSPAAKHHYPVLEDSLRQLHDLHDTIQQMRDVSVIQTLNPDAFRLSQSSRLSASCPSLNEAGIDAEPQIGSLGSSPSHNTVSSRKGSAEWMLCHGLGGEGEAVRRRSWTALEDLTCSKEKHKHERQRSISLSSMESEADESSIMDAVDGAARLLMAQARNRAARNSTGGGASTHSLNEADLQNDFNKLKAKREAESLRLLPARLPLQKSISTPSIIAVGELTPEPILAGAKPTLPVCRPSGTEESETEDEVLVGHRWQGDAAPLICTKVPVHLLQHAVQHEKRRKRGSLFFRKKKDKIKKVTHQWVSASYSSSNICDWCSKPKPSLYCENCTATVHQNTCMDQIVDCNKPKNLKNIIIHKSAFSGSLTSSKSSSNKRNSGSHPGKEAGYNKRSQLCYSPWRRVATKLGVNQIINEEKEVNHSHLMHHDTTNFPDDIPILPLEFLSDTPLTAADLGTDPILGLQDNEPDSWTPAVGKELARRLKEKEVKRQEHIYEFIMTEKTHCMTLLVMQKVFVEGFQKYFHLGPSLERMFPRLADLTEMHLGLLARLRQRQRESPVVLTIADILLEQFSSTHAARLKSAYGEFCSRHRDAVDMYKYYMQSDARFAQFVRHCQANPLLKKKGIPECILFVTQRLTKYPLLIEPLIKTSKENKLEQEKLQRALALVKEILVEVDAQVAEKEKEDRKLEIYNRIDAKSYTMYRKHKFKKSDILQGSRNLKFEGVAMLMQGRGKMQPVIVIVLSDVLFFLQENSQKYSFFTPDNKAGVVSLQKLLVREKAGQDSRGIYLISSNPADPEMFELKVHKPKDKQVWIQAIRSAVQNCPEDEEEEKLKLLNAKQAQIRDIVGLLRQKDVEQALLLEEKMNLQLRLLETAGLGPPSPPPSYRHLVSENADTGVMWKEVLSAVHEVSQLASSLYASGTNLSRSVSSVGEHQSEAYVSPTLPKRAETFGGFDNAAPGGPGKVKNVKPTSVSAGAIDNDKSAQSEKLPWRNAMLNTVPPGVLAANNQQQSGQTGGSNAPGPPDLPTLLTLGKEQQEAAVQLTHYVYTLMCIISQQMTSIDSLHAQLSACRSVGAVGGSPDSVSLSGGIATGLRPTYRHNQQLEELRNLQDKFSGEKAAWQQKRDQEQKELDEQKAELVKLQEQIRAEQSDITQQREQLYRKMEVLSSQGLLISPSVALPVAITPAHDDNTGHDDTQGTQITTNNNSDTGTMQPEIKHRRHDSNKWSKSAPTNKSIPLPLNLISAANQQKVTQSLPIKQQLPLKLASRLSSSPANTQVTSSPQVTSQQASMSGPQQMLPMKLSQDEKTTRRSSAGYQRLSSGSFSPPGDMPMASGHSRTDSSPAMIPDISSQHYSTLPQPMTKTTRTHTYPKIPDRFRVRSPEQPKSPPATNTAQTQPPEEEVIFF